MSTMKNIIYLSLLFPLCLGSCSEKDLDQFSSSQSSVYFNVPSKTETYLESTIFSFSERTNSIDTLAIPVALLGLPANTERFVDFEVVADSTTAIKGVHYDFVEERIAVTPTVNSVNLQVILYRDASLQENDFVIRVNLKENEWFTVAPREEIINSTTGKKVTLYSHKITLTGKVAPPPMNRWNEGNYFGTYSIKKYMVVNEVNNIKPSDWEKALPSTVQIWATKTRNYLQRQYDNGTPIYEDEKDTNGKPVLMRVAGVTF